MKLKVIKIANEELTLIIDEPDCGKHIADVIVTPAFGITAKKIFPLSYFLLRNGFRVFRLDFRHHVGLSTGEIANAALSKQVEDIIVAITETKCSLVVALSLSARAVIKAMSTIYKPVDSVLIAPVVDVRATLEAVSKEDLFDIDTSKKKSVDIIGYHVKTTFIDDCINSGIETWEDAANDLIKSKGRCRFIAGDNDPWVSFSHIKSVSNAVSKSNINFHLLQVEAASHKIDRNPSVAATYFEIATRECLKLINCTEELITIPNFRDVIRVANTRNKKRVSEVC